ncbi:MAG: hypothetical protein IJ168_11600 [Eubacterium sp.]|nr:hypothetical protein [Eubacterium sp.]
MNDITLDGGGAVFVIHGDLCALALLQCSRIRLKNFTVRYAAPSNVEFTVKAINNHSVTYQLSTAAYELNSNRLTFFAESPFSQARYFSFTDNDMTDCWVCHDGENVFRVWNESSPLSHVKEINRLSERELQIQYAELPPVKEDAVYAVSPNHNRHTCGVFFGNCADIRCENITVNYLTGFGWLSQLCRELSFERLRFVPAPGYHVTSFADCLHICSCKGKVSVRDCTFTHSHDDAINIHGVFLRTKEIISEREAVFEFAHRQQGGYAPLFPGDRVKFYDRRNLAQIGTVYTVKSVKNNITAKTVAVVFDEPLPDLQPLLSVADNIDYHPEVEITDCVFRAIPTRGILCTTDKKAVICANTFSSVAMADIYISCDCNEWYESGPCENMQIFGNRFSKENAVVIEPICLEEPVKNVHKNILIYDNR